MKLTDKQIQFIIDELDNSNTTLESTGHWIDNFTIEKCANYYIINGKALVLSKEDFIKWLEESDENFELVTIIRIKI